MTPRSDPPQRPLDEDDRERALQRLRDAYADGLVPHEEMDGRLDRVLAARTHGELASLLASLSPERPGTTSTIAAAGGRIRRRGAWRVPRVLKVGSAFGKVRLDPSRAVIEHPVVDTERQLGTGGDVHLRRAPGARCFRCAPSGGGTAYPRRLRPATER